GERGHSHSARLETDDRRQRERRRGSPGTRPGDRGLQEGHRPDPAAREPEAHGRGALARPHAPATFRGRVAARGPAYVRMIDIEKAFRVLAEGGVEFIVVGGVAARAHGSARLTNDLDVVYRRTAENMARLAAALAPHAPYLRGAPAGLPFRCARETLRRRMPFTLSDAIC